MREMEPKFELFAIARVGAGNRIVGAVAGTGIARLWESRGTAREFKNTGNKARMLLKTKRITFFEGCKSGTRGAPIAANQALKGAKNTTIRDKRSRSPASQGEAEQGQVVG
jgi:hypothetical protein